MAIGMIKCVMGDKGMEVTRTTWETGTEDELKKLRDASSPAAFVIAKENLKFFTELKSLVENRSIKRKTTGLGKYLLKRKLIPAIDGNYDATGKLKNGVVKLLQGAREKKDSNIYIIGTGKEIFQDLYKTIVGVAQPARSPMKEKPVSCSPHPNGITLSDLLDDVKVDPELESTYVGNEPEVILVRKLIARVAPSKGTILVLGDTGTGKELVAQGIHKFSNLKGEFVAVNCGAIPRELFEYELFGSVSNRSLNFPAKKGLWEEAEDGTLFLDEIAELLPEHQTKVLRTLSSGKIRPVGSLKEVRVNARVVAATNKNLLSLVKVNLFREDLYYRLRGIFIHTPSLREHPRDIPVLIEHIWKNKVKAPQPLPQDVISRLQRYSWPGNVRELKIVLFDLHILFPNIPILTVDHVDAVFQYQGRLVQTEKEWVSTETERQRMESWHHLYRVFEVISVAEMNVRSLLKSPRPDQSAFAQTKFELQNRINEIEILCLYPGRFQPEAYHAVAMLRSKITNFMNLLKEDVSSALECMESDGLNEFSSALSHVKKEIESLANRY